MKMQRLLEGPSDSIYLEGIGEAETPQSHSKTAGMDNTSTLSCKSSTADYSGASNPGSAKRRVQLSNDVKMTHTTNA